MSDTGGNQPIKSYRLGGVSASIFCKEVGESGNRQHFTTLQRRYRDQDGQWQSGALRLQDIPLAIRCLERAQTFLEESEHAS